MHIYRSDNPIIAAPIAYIRPEGMTVKEILDSIPDLPVGWSEYGVVRIREYTVPRHLWPYTRPKVIDGIALPLTLTMDLFGGGGSSSSGKNTLATVAAIAVIVAAAAISGGALAPLATTLGLPFTLAAGSVSASVAGATFAIAGSLAIGALTSPPTIEQAQRRSSGSNLKPAASLSGNVLARGGAIPRIAGRHHVFPPLATPILFEVVGDYEWAEGTYVLAGPHHLQDQKVGNIPIAELDPSEIETEYREGWDDDTDLTLITRYGITEGVGTTLEGHDVVPDDQRQLADQADPENSFPKPLRFRTEIGFDEWWGTLSFPAGLASLASTDAPISLPIRVMLTNTETGEEIRLPEVHFSHFKNEPVTKMIKIVRGTAPSIPAPNTSRAPLICFERVPMRFQNGFIGNFGSAAQNDNTLGTGNTAGANSEYWFGIPTESVYARQFDRVEIWPDPVASFASAASDLTFQLYVNNSTPANATDGTLVQTVIIEDATTTQVPIIFKNFGTRTEANIWWRVTRTSGGNFGFGTNETRIFGPQLHPSWCAHDHFRVNENVFEAYLNSANFASTNVANTVLDYETMTCYVDEDTLPAGSYDVTVVRGCPYKNSVPSDIIRYFGNGNTSQLTTGIVMDLFGFVVASGSNYRTYFNYDDFSANAGISRSASVFNSPPVVTGTGLTIMCIKTKRAAEDFSVDAGGYVPAWNGVDAWDDWIVSDNPADVYRYILNGGLNARPLPTALIDDDILLEWRARNIADGRTVNAVFEGRKVTEALQVVASCGWARPRQSEKWGVVQDYDTSAESPIQFFTDRNFANFAWDKAFPKLPDGFRVRYDEITLDYKEQEYVVLRPGAADTGLYEDLRLEGFTHLVDSHDRALFDLRQFQFRSTFYTGETNLQHLVAIRGSLVGLSVDVLSRRFSSAYVDTVLTSGANATGLVLSDTVYLQTDSTYGIGIRYLNQTSVIKQITVPSEGHYKTITFTTPFTDPGTSVLDRGCLVFVGPLTQVYKRVKVLDIRPKSAFLADITFVDEAPELWDQYAWSSSEAFKASSSRLASSQSRLGILASSTATLASAATILASSTP